MAPRRESVTVRLVRFTLPVFVTLYQYLMMSPTVAVETLAVLVIASEGENVVGTLTDAFTGPTEPPHGSVPLAVAVLFIGAQMSNWVTV